MLDRLLGPIALPPQLLLRALDDLHAIAAAARDLPARFDQLDARAIELLEATANVLAIEERLNARFDALDEQTGRLLEAAAATNRRVGEASETARDLVGYGRAMLERSDEVLAQTERVNETAREVAVQGARVADTLPTLEAAVAAASTLATTAEPLQGLTERLGRLADRLPGAPR